MTSICYIGSKSLSHVLSSIERCKERLLTLALGTSAEAAQNQIIESVMSYWKDQPGIGVNIVDKLLNYTILSPTSVIRWALSTNGERLGKTFVFEMVSATVGKVTKRLRQVTLANNMDGLLPDMQEGLVLRERKSMKDLFQLMEEELDGWVQGSKSELIVDQEIKAMIKQWGERWLRVFRRKLAVEDGWLLEAEAQKEKSAAVLEEKSAEEGNLDLDIANDDLMDV